MSDRPLPNILGKIRDTKLGEIEKLLKEKPMAQLEREAASRLQIDRPRPFEKNIAMEPRGMVNVIAEVKKASPSKGLIRPDFDPIAIAKAYAAGGASAISCLTDETYFQGKLDYLQMVRAATTLPVLRKDFLIDRAQIFQACAVGADAVLLIARMLDVDELTELYRLSKSLGMGVLLEIHDEPDLEKALEVNPSLLGINNRDLDTFVVDFENTLRLREKIPASIPLVSESGIGSRDQLERLAENNVRAVLVGESLMRQDDVEEALKKLLR